MAEIIEYEWEAGIPVMAGLDLHAEKPLDYRSVVQTIEARDALVSSHNAYPGMIVYVTGTTETPIRQNYVYSYDTEGTPAWLLLASEATIRSIFTEMFTAAAKAGYANDIRTYPGGIETFPLCVKVEEPEGSGKYVYYTTTWESSYIGAIPAEHVEYIDNETQTEYVWEPITGSTYSGVYKMVNQTAEMSEIGRLF